MISYCVVNTDGRELLLRGLDAIARERATLAIPSEVLVLDNGSQDGSVAAVRARGEDLELIALPERRGKAANDSELLQRARGEFCLLLNEDSELLPGASAALLAALAGDPRAACAGAKLLRPDGAEQACAWRFPGVASAALGALLLHRRFVVQSRRGGRVDWAQSAALLVRRRAAEQVGWMDPAFFVYSDEVDFQKRLSDAGWHTLYVPEAVAIHHEQLAGGSPRRIVQLARGRDMYMRKHHGPRAAWLVRWLTAWPYLLRAIAAVLLPGHDPRRYLAHARAAIRPQAGLGLEDEAAGS
ncbi:MAG: glycosyltransferase family 2 protein [Solirubrobacteraceae bacterium]